MSDALKILAQARRPSVILTAMAFFAAYLLLDLREGGRNSSLTTTRLSTPRFYIDHFGGWFFWGAVVLDVALALTTALLLVTSLSRYRERRAMGVCTTGATLLFGFALFGCPGCMMPLFGTLGIAAFANALPLFGLEFKLVSLLVTLGALVWTARESGARDADDGGSGAFAAMRRHA